MRIPVVNDPEQLRNASLKMQQRPTGGKKNKQRIMNQRGGTRGIWKGWGERSITLKR